MDSLRHARLEVLLLYERFSLLQTKILSLMEGCVSYMRRNLAVVFISTAA